jgi:ArsR family transcriptional regulator
MSNEGGSSTQHLISTSARALLRTVRFMAAPRTGDRPSGRTRALDAADAKFRAFSDPTRLRILRLLQGGELCVGDLVKITRVPQPTASRHLAYLRRAKLVTTRKDDIWAYCKLAAVQSVFHQKLLECLTHCFEEVAELKCDAARAARVRQSGGCCPT